MDIDLASKQLDRAIGQADNILLICHQQPDADAIGSMVALASLLDAREKTYTLFCIDPVPDNLEWLNNFASFETDPKVITEGTHDLAIVVDSSDLQYAGVDDFLAQRNPKPVIVSIDHHATNEGFGDLNIINKTASSTCEIIYQLLAELRFSPPPRVASAMLAGIIGDTYGFTNPNTSEVSLSVSEKLLKNGGSLTQVSDSLIKNKTVDHLKLWGRVLERLQYNEKLGIAVTVVLKEDLEEFDLDIEVTEGISNFLNNLSDVKAALVLIQQGEMVKGSFRTNNDLIDVSQLAKLLGGGGHKKAAGFKVKGEIIKDAAGHWQIA